MIKFNDLTKVILPIQKEIEKAISNVVVSGQYIRGEQTHLFEEEWAAYCGQKYCVACSNGTDAITLAAHAMRFSHIKVPANTVWYTIDGLRKAMVHATIVDVTTKGQLQNPSVDTVCVPLYGNFPINRELECKLFDAAQAHGWKPPEHATVTWSFYPTKNLGALGDAGAITTNDEYIYQQAMMLTGRDDQYRTPNQITSRIDEVQAAILRVRLRYLDDNLRLRREAAAIYKEHLPKSIDIVNEYADYSNYHLFVIRVKPPLRPLLQKYLFQNNVETKVHYPVPLHKQESAPWYDSTLNLPNSVNFANSILSLPFYPGISIQDITTVSNLITRFIENTDQDFSPYGL